MGHVRFAVLIDFHLEGCIAGEVALNFFGQYDAVVVVANSAFENFVAGNSVIVDFVEIEVDDVLNFVFDENDRDYIFVIVFFVYIEGVEIVNDHLVDLLLDDNVQLVSCDLHDFVDFVIAPNNDVVAVVVVVEDYFEIHIFDGDALDHHLGKRTVD